MKPISKTILSLIIFSLLCTWISAAQEDKGRTAAALELLTLMNMDKMLSQAIDVMLAAQIKSNPALKPYEDIMKDFIGKYMSWHYLKDKMVKIYADEFTEKELRDMIDFYRTDTGRKAAEKMPVLMSKGSEMGEQAIQDHMSELTDAIQKRMNEMNEKQ